MRGVARRPRACLSLLLLGLVALWPALAAATILVTPKNVAVPCPPGTRIVFRPFFGNDNQLIPDAWTITAITKSGETASSGSFIIRREGPTEGAAEVIAMIAETCEELGGTSLAAGSPRITIATGRDPADAFLGSFNGDNLPDLAVANQGSNNVSIALGTPGGGFGPTVTVPTGTGPVRVVGGDFHGDGHQDLITVNVGTGLTGDLSLLRGNGNGTFQPPASIAAGTLPLDVVAGDWNGDGKLDLAAADGTGNAVVVLLGNGNGTFQAPVSLPTNTFSTASIVAADLNGDGHLDLITNGAVFLNNGNGTFQPAITFASGLQPRLARAGDVDRDGKVDLITASSGQHIVSVHLGNGDGTVRPARHYVVGASPDEVALFDVDGDGILDLVVSSAGDPHASVLRGRGDGTFVASSAYPAVSNIGAGAFSVAAADFTGDGVPDLVTSDAALLPGLGLGRFGAAVALPGLSGSRVIAADWNGDGKTDLALVTASSSSPGSARIALGNGNGTFGAPASLALPAGFSPFARFALAADVDGDGTPDLIVASPGANAVSVFVSLGNGSFAARPDIGGLKQPTWLAAGDVNHDGKVDLVIANNGDFNAGNGSIEVRLGNGDGTFGPPVILRGAIEPDSVALGDVHGDGHLDVVAVVQSPVFDWNLNVFRGRGDGSFEGAAVVSLPQDLVSGIRLADLDLDGRPDVVVSLEGTQVGLLRNRGDGTFDPPILVDAGGGLAVVADVDRDSRPDLIVATQIGLVTVLLNGSTTGAPGTIASVLPASRAVSVGSAATAFATILNASGVPFSNCGIVPIASLPAAFLFQTTDPATNLPTGAANTRVSIGAGQAQTFVIAFTPSAPFPPIDVELAFNCDGVIAAAPIPSVNTLVLSARSTPGPDIIALAASAAPGRLIAAPAGAAAIATANVGAAGDVTISADTGGTSLPVALAWCQTDAVGACIGAPTSSPLPVSVGAGATSTFGVFAAVSASIAFDPAAHRVFFRVRDGQGRIIGATSLALSGGP